MIVDLLARAEQVAVGEADADFVLAAAAAESSSSGASVQESRTRTSTSTVFVSGVVLAGLDGRLREILLAAERARRLVEQSTP